MKKPANETRNKLLEHAAALVQTRGYNGFSYHDLATELGIKTASIHYYFPAKGDLGKALVEKYTNTFLQALGDPSGNTPDERLHDYIELFRRTLIHDRMCLCGILAAEVDTIPSPVRDEVRAFFQKNEQWLSSVYMRQNIDRESAHKKAQLMLAALEGAMLVARTGNDYQIFNDVAQLIATR